MLKVISSLAFNVESLHLIFCSFQDQDILVFVDLQAG